MRTLVIILILFSFQAKAALYRPQWEGIRPMGMGNAFLALADDYNVVFYNPAGLALVDSVHASLHLHTGFDGQDSLSRMLSMLGGNASGFLGDTQHFIRLGSPLSFITRYFGGAIIADSTTYVDLQGLQLPDIEIQARNDLGGIVGMGIPISRYFAAGFSLKGIMRVGLERRLTPAQLLNELGLDLDGFSGNVFGSLRRLAQTGYSLGLNFGVLARLPFKKPHVQLGATIEDFGYTTFLSTKFLVADNVPPRISPSYNFGLALIWDLNGHTSRDFKRAKRFRRRARKRAKVVLTLDARDVTGDVPYNKMFHLGLETQLPGIMLRTGVFQGDWTAGLSLDVLPHTRIHLTSYGYNTGTTVRERLMRIYMLQFTLGFNPL